MSDFFARLARNIAANAVAPVEAAGARLMRMAGLGGIAVLCLLGALVFLSIALDLWLAQWAGPVLAAVAAGGFYLLVALIAFLILRLRRTDDAALRKSAASAKAAPPGSEAFASNVEEAVAPFVAILQQTGLKREEVAVRLAAEASKQFGPLTLLALALAVGFLSERALDRRKPSD